jgi:DNA mismatch endonuclease (patch repair protein)
MADVFTAEKRSQVMSRIRSGNTKPELTVRSMLHRLGYRFTVNGPKNKALPGRPDLVLPKYHTVVFVHGCFWHGHAGCKDFRIPSTRTEWWTAKLNGNIARDSRSEKALQQMGGRVIVIWACELKTAAVRKELEMKLSAYFQQSAAIPSRKL